MRIFSTNSRKIRRRAKPVFAWASIYVFGALPLLVNRFIGTVCGYLVYLIPNTFIKVSRDNIGKAFPDLSQRQQRRLVKQSIIETAKTALETATVWRRSYTVLKKYMLGVENLELLTQPSPNGLILLAPHLGNWEYLGHFLAQHVDITIIYQPSGLEALDNIIIAGRCREGVKLAPANKKGVAMVVQALRAGRCVGILPDQVPDRSGGQVEANFFQQPAWTMTLVYKLIQRTACKVIVGFAQRVPKGFQIKFNQVEHNLYHHDEIISAQALNTSVENCVKIVPEQYQWEYKRYKRL